MHHGIHPELHNITFNNNILQVGSVGISNDWLPVKAGKVTSTYSNTTSA